MADSKNSNFKISAGLRVGLMIAGGQINGLGLTLKSMDADKTGLDDIAGTACVAASHVLIAFGAGSDGNATVQAIDGAIAALAAVRELFTTDTAAQTV